MTPGELIERIKHGDVEAAQELVERHSDVVAGYLRRHLNHREASDAPDVSQEVWLRFWQELMEDNLRAQSDGELDAWLSRMVRNLLVDLKRRQTAQLRDVRRNVGDAAIASVPASDTTASQVARLHELELRLQRRMTPSEVKIVEMKLDGHTVQEIAEEAGKSPGAIKQKLLRLQRRLKQDSSVLP
jgi:RNA polymerase sigma-70 factor (ECF subfamily)